MELNFQPYIPSTGKFQRKLIKKRPKPLSRSPQLQRSPLVQSWTTTDQVVDLTGSYGNSQVSQVKASELGILPVAFAFGLDENAFTRQDEEIHIDRNITERMSTSNEREPTEISIPPHPLPSSSEQPSLSRNPSCNHPPSPLLSPSPQDTVIEAKANEQPADRSLKEPCPLRDLDFTLSPRAEPTDGFSSSQTAIDSQETGERLCDEVIFSDVKKTKERIRYGPAIEQIKSSNTNKPLDSSQEARPSQGISRQSDYESDESPCASGTPHGAKVKSTGYTELSDMTMMNGQTNDDAFPYIGTNHRAIRIRHAWPRISAKAIIQATLAATLSREVDDGEIEDDCIWVSTAKMSSSSKQDISTPLAVDEGVNWELDEILGKEQVDEIWHYLVRWKSSIVPQHELDFIVTQGEIDGEPEEIVVDGILYYKVQWRPNLVPEHEIDAPELIHNFEATFGRTEA